MKLSQARYFFGALMAIVILCIGGANRVQAATITTMEELSVTMTADLQKHETEVYRYELSTSMYNQINNMINEYQRVYTYTASKMLLGDIVYKKAENQLSCPKYGGDYLDEEGIASGGFQIFMSGDELIMMDNFRYSTTEQQENELSSAIENLCSTGELSAYKNSSKAEQIKKAQEYVARHVEYSYLGNEDAYYLTAHAAYYQGKSDCRGQALLLYRILREFGIANRVVCEYISEYQTGHLWNLVYLDGKWYCCDVGSGVLLKGSDNFSPAKNTYEEHSINGFQTNIGQYISTSDYSGSNESTENPENNESSENQPSQSDKTGLYQANDGCWYLYDNGNVNYSYNGLYNDSSQGWWLVQNGKVDFNYNDLYCDSNVGWWKVAAGAVDFDYTDLYCSPTCGWWKVYGGRVDFDYTDLYCSPSCGWWKVNGGSVDFGYTDLYDSPSCGWWKVKGGSVDFGYTDLYNSPSCGWWKVYGGKVDFDYTDLYDSPSCGWWKVNGGSVDFGYTDLYNSPSCGWWKVNGGSVDFGYTDLYDSPSCGWWKVNGGSVDFGYSDLYDSPRCGWWKVSGGRVDFGYSDLYDSPSCGWWKVNGGSVDFGYSDLYDSPSCGWWKVNGGSVDFGYTGLYNSPQYGEWYIENGAVRF